MQIIIPVKVAAKKPAKDFRGGKRRALIPGKFEGKGGVCRPHNRPIVEAVVSDHARLPPVSKSLEDGQCERT